MEWLVGAIAVIVFVLGAASWVILSGGGREGEQRAGGSVWMLGADASDDQDRGDGPAGDGDGRHEDGGFGGDGGGGDGGDGGDGGGD
jgi:hypothetical protein